MMHLQLSKKKFQKGPLSTMDHRQTNNKPKQHTPIINNQDTKQKLKIHKTKDSQNSPKIDIH
jgi:hypothetical protein